ncbi:MAG TPA: glycosyltransferase family A protein [Candidatus Binatia bacterium]
MLTTGLRLSVIIPVHNDATGLSECLTALKAAGSPDREIIVVDDASTDETPRVAESFGVRVLRLMRNSGPAAARNYGARHAGGDIVFFVDADVMVAPGALRRVEAVFQEQPDLAAVFGSYDARPRAEGTISQYRNLLHHFVHQTGHSEASTFWAGCGAIRRTVFDSIGGFDEKKFLRPSIEDIELGYRLRQAGHRILLDKSLQVTHLKKWTFSSVIRTDIFRRALPWAHLILESRQSPNDLNLKLAQRLSGLIVMLACLLALLGAFRSELLVVSGVAFLSVVALNRELYAFFWKQRGLRFAAACIPLHLLYYLYSGMTYLCVWIGFQIRAASLFTQR